MATQLRKLLRFWFRLDAAVNRHSYSLNGFSLAAVKYLGDLTLVWLTTGQFWKPTDYLHTTHSLLATTLPGAPQWLMPALGIWTLPFLWIGATLTWRRALDAGLSPWWTMGFFVPYFNYLLMAALCLIPSSSNIAQSSNVTKLAGKRVPSALRAIGAGIILGIVMAVFGVLYKGQYGFSLFLGAPFAMGALTAFVFNRGYSGTLKETNQVTFLMFGFVAGLLFLFAFEGALCIAMAVPLGLVIGLLGAAVGRAIAQTGRRAMPPAITAMLLLPLSIAFEPAKLTGQMLHEVQSSVVINAPPERVWSHVIAFEPIAEPTDVIFRLGIAYPRYAYIEGDGVHAVRYCVFSTGPFLEPITAWEPGKRLGFDVQSSPDPLRELSIYANVSPPHLHGYLRSRRGEFRLVALSRNRTRLEGSTWYELEMAPEAYWRLWTDFVIHRIHDRVLQHIKAEAEASAYSDSTVRIAAPRLTQSGAGVGLARSATLRKV
jgi:uncharacterized membrane protein YhaH (DUF805 family)